MLIKRIEKIFNPTQLKEDARKLGVNLITAGIVGIFLNHFNSINKSDILWPAFGVIIFGTILLILGLTRTQS